MNGTRVGGRNRVDVVTGDGEQNDACAIGVGRMKNRDPNAKRDYGVNWGSGSRGILR